MFLKSYNEAIPKLIPSEIPRTKIQIIKKLQRVFRLVSFECFILLLLFPKVLYLCPDQSSSNMSDSSTRHSCL